VSVRDHVESAGAASPNSDELVARARALAPFLLEQAADTEERSTYSDEVHKRFEESGLYQLYVPKRYGGYEVDVPTYLRVAIELARGDLSAAWCFTLAANHALQVGSWFPEVAQDIVFANGDFRAASMYAPSVKATPVNGGWQLDGVVSYCSGIPHSTYYLGQAAMPGKNPDGSPRVLLMVVPRDQFEILDDWGNTLGLRGSGSNSIRFTGGFVSSDLVIEDANMADFPVDGGTPGSQLHGNPMYAGRALNIFAITLGALVIGAGYGALDEYERQMRTRTTPLPPIGPRIDDPDFQRWYGTALGKLATAEAAVLQAAQQHMDFCRLNASGERPYTFADDVKLGVIGREAIVQAWEAVEQNLYRTIGSSASKSGERFERIFRDMAQAAGHRNTSLREPSYRQLAVLELGITPPQGS
jgi:3-hydroxy-9,10-secoandrosta-1,3,5(10)-triene-9,17-dione monooxygenase